MKRDSGCLIAASILILSGISIFIYGFNPWFRPRVTVKKLSMPNPTSWTFTASTEQILTVLKERAVRCCGIAIEFKGNALFSGSTLKLPGNENDAYIHNFHEPIGPSPVYFSGANPLLYISEFHLHMVPKSSSETEVIVVAHKSEVIDGQSWWGLHGSPANIYRSVAPTTIEEYRVLLDLGSALGTTNMPLIRLPLGSEND